MLTVLSPILALLAAATNALGTVMQRRAATVVPRSSGLRIGLMWDLLRTPVWLLGMGGVVLSAMFQGAALATGALAVVQPLFMLELPFVLLLASVVSGRPLPRAGWLPVGSIGAGLCLTLFAAAPTGGTLPISATRWTPVVSCCLLAVTVLCGVAVKLPNGPSRAACMGLAAAVAYSLTAALMKSSTVLLGRQGMSAFLTAWQTYAFATLGVCALFLLENAMQSGPLVASQPALTLGDTLVSLALGVTLYGERLRGGWWLALQVFGLTLVAYGVTRLSRQRLVPAGM
ncbi:DMT family transporter [Streptomyces sp. NPDC046870]|uniref:DMT family transporter n=1 Tax=Streptomyces sp. NPDC046870 TaxID=3155135 RepID=UPI0034520B96